MFAAASAARAESIGAGALQSTCSQVFGVDAAAAGADASSTVARTSVGTASRRRDTDPSREDTVRTAIRLHRRCLMRTRFVNDHRLARLRWGVSFSTLALVGAIALAGPLLALPAAWHLPVVLGELAGGIILGPTVLRVLHAPDPTFTLLADVGFALVMFVAGSHVPIRDPRLRAALPVGLLRAALVGALAAAVGVVLARAFGTGHAAL